MNNRIEILISTYNRPNILKEWIYYGKVYFEKLGFAIAVYDSSTNSETENLIHDYNLTSYPKIKYVHVDSCVRLDDKIMQSILESEYEYVWPMGDSRILDFDDIQKKVLPNIEKEVDFCCMFDMSEAKDGEQFIDANTFFRKCFWHATLLGGIIFRKDIFNPLMNRDYLYECNKKYNRNDGFSYLGIFYDLIAGRKINAVYTDIHITDIGKNKTPGWIHRYMSVWCDNLIYLIDSIDDVYNNSKEEVLKYTWKVLNLDGVEWLYKARLAGGLSQDIYDYYDKNGYLDRVSDHKKRIRQFAFDDIRKLKVIYSQYLLNRKVFSGLRRIKKALLKKS